MSAALTAGVTLFGLALTGRAQGNALFEDPGNSVVRNLYGEVGLLDIPSGHMAPDGEIAFTVGDLRKSQRYSVSVQILPWLEGSFRYSGIDSFGGYSMYFDRSFGLKARVLKEDGLLPDVSLGVRDALGTGVYSGEYIAASKQIGDFDITLGLGWGRLSDQLSFKNPFTYLSQSFIARNGAQGGVGQLNYGTFFHGPRTGAFGGLSWRTPIEGLKLLAEFSSDGYVDEARALAGLHVRAPVNVGLSYNPNDAIGFSAGWMYGTTYGFSINLSGDPATTYPSALRIGPNVPEPTIRTDEEKASALIALRNLTTTRHGLKNGDSWVTAAQTHEQARLRLLQDFYSVGTNVSDIDFMGTTLMVDARLAADSSSQCASYAKIAAAGSNSFSTIALNDTKNVHGRVIFCHVQRSPLVAALSDISGDARRGAAEDKIRADLAAQDLRLTALYIGESDATVYFENGRYRNTAQAIGRVVRVLMADAPPSVELFHIYPTQWGVQSEKLTILRSTVERNLADGGTYKSGMGGIGMIAAPLDNPVFENKRDAIYPTLSYALSPKVTEHVFDPDKPLQFLVYGEADGLLAVAPGLIVSLQLTGSIWTNYTYTRDAQSELPHVRTDILKYLKHGRYGVSSLAVSYTTRLAPQIFAHVRAGLLEDMFAGVGGQMLWRPSNSRFAFGADLYEVWQRDYHRLFSLQDYHTTTGHVTMYYESPWHGLTFTTRLGRYLAKDNGATIEISRKFDSGIVIGGWVTLTNVPKSTFGEGSFDKGIMIHIPLEWGLPVWSQTAYDLHLSSLTRDGGQRLGGDDSLYDITNGNSYGEIAKHIGEIVAP